MRDCVEVVVIGACAPRRFEEAVLNDRIVGSRRRVLGTLLGCLAMVLIVAPTTVAASATYQVTAHFVEPVAPDIQRDDCALEVDGFCGTGTFAPFGRVTETIEFGAGCRGGCDLRTIVLDDGTLVLEESYAFGGCRGVCRSNPAFPQSGLLTSVIVAGTGSFEGASGTLTGTVELSGHLLPAGESQIRLTGTITIAD